MCITEHVLRYLIGKTFWCCNDYHTHYSLNFYILEIGSSLFEFRSCATIFRLKSFKKSINKLQNNSIDVSSESYDILKPFEYFLHEKLNVKMLLVLKWYFKPISNVVWTHPTFFRFHHRTSIAIRVYQWKFIKTYNVAILIQFTWQAVLNGHIVNRGW